MACWAGITSSACILSRKGTGNTVRAGSHKIGVWRVGIYPISPLLLLLLSACITYHEVRTVGGPIYVRENMPLCDLRTLKLAVPTVGLFIGVSNYGPGAGVFSTPAHGLSAGLFEDPFSRAAVRSPKDWYKTISLADVPKRVQEENLPDPAGLLANMTLGFSFSGNSVSRKQIDEALNAAIADAEAKFAQHGQVLLVLYVSAHGWLDADGEANLLPSDAAADKPATWIRYREVLDRLQAFLSRNDAAAPGRRVIAFFDTCQVRQVRGAPGVPLPIPPAGMTVVTSTSPGQYAWHWTGAADVSYTQQVVSETRIGFGLPPPAPSGEIERHLRQTISVVPVAHRCALKELVPKLQAGQVVTEAQWLSAVQAKASDFLRDVREMRELGARQDIVIQYDPSGGARPLFVVDNAAP